MKERRGELGHAAENQLACGREEIHIKDGGQPLQRGKKGRGKGREKKASPRSAQVNDRDSHLGFRSGGGEGEWG